jgi:hypothetical protein
MRIGGSFYFALTGLDISIRQLTQGFTLGYDMTPFQGIPVKLRG